MLATKHIKTWAEGKELTLVMGQILSWHKLT